MKHLRHFGARPENLRILEPFDDPFFVQFALDIFERSATFPAVFVTLDLMAVDAAETLRQNAAFIETVRLRDFDDARVAFDAGSLHMVEREHVGIPFFKFFPVIFFTPSFALLMTLGHMGGILETDRVAISS